MCKTFIVVCTEFETLKFLMYEFGLCTVEHTDSELFQSSFVYGCVNCVVVCKDFENFKAFQC